MTTEMRILRLAECAANWRRDKASAEVLHWAYRQAKAEDDANKDRALDNVDFTIYRIYDVQSRELLYIGCTCQDLRVRLVNHCNHALYQFRQGHIETATPTGFRRCSGIVLSMAGFRRVAARAICVVRGKTTARIVETTLIQSERPKWNAHGLADRLSENARHAMRVHYAKRKAA